jgi:hypothetical protein
MPEPQSSLLFIATLVALLCYKLGFYHGRVHAIQTVTPKRDSNGRFTKKNVRR